ncbi:MAG: DsbA family protein [Candidatus Saccharimonadales bacterium]
MDKIKWIIFAALVLVVFGGIIFFNKSSAPSFSGDATKAITAGPIADHVYGSDEQKVVLIEYGDFQCPGCGGMYPTVKDLKEQYKDKLTFIFRNFPLTNIHPNALAASTAAEAAGMQNKFFEMHDALFENQKAWQDAAVNQRGAIFEGYASSLGLDVEKFKQDMSSQTISEKISRDRTTGRDVFKVDQTPSFVLNGKLLPADVATSQEKLAKAVEEAVKQAYPDAQIPPATKPEGQQ